MNKCEISNKINITVFCSVLYSLSISLPPSILPFLLVRQPLLCAAQRRESMVTKATDSASKPQSQHGEPMEDTSGTLASKIDQMRKQIQEERIISVKEKLQKNGENLQHQISAILSVISSWDSSQTKENRASEMLSSRINQPQSKYLSLFQLLGENNPHGIPAPSIRLPSIEKIPTYTTWMHLARNEKMSEDQSIIGRRRIYYEKHGGEALICSDSDEEVTENEGVKHEFSEGEDRLLWMAFEELGLTDEVLNIVSQSVQGTSLEIQDRYKDLKAKSMGRQNQHHEDSGEYKPHIGICLEKSLSAALDSFDNLFCRRCIQLFDCPLHGCSQPLIYPSEKQPVWSEPEGDRKPCSDQCYLLLKDVKMLSECSTPGSLQGKITATEEADEILAPSSGEGPSNQSTKAISQEERRLTEDIGCCGDLKSDVPVPEIMGKRKVKNKSDSALRDSILPPEDSQTQNSSKKMKKISDDIVTGSNDHNSDLNLDACNEEKQRVTHASSEVSVEHTSGSSGNVKPDKDFVDRQKDTKNEIEFKNLYSSMEAQVDEKLSFSDWKPLEKELYFKGVEMFGRNSCLIARNLLSGLKTCKEVATYMSFPHTSSNGPSSITDENGKITANRTMSSRSRTLRKRGKTRKSKYSSKSAGIPFAWKRIASGKNQSIKQYTPCECQTMCGKDCPCQTNETCCEKYCGCSDICKNRYRGCHCAKSQCRSRQCPCFAAGRECDPDVCRNCWVSCGGGSLGEPPRRGDGHCGNMRMLLRQRQRILLAKSSLVGWGAFIKNSVNKNDYLGEYTGELISHKEADKRGKIYDRENSSFLFNLNDQLVLDACRKGDKLKFANHWESPNCVAKVMLVAGDHRVGIFANKNINAGEELFYDYCYEPEHRPPWAVPKGEASKRDESAANQGRAKKNQSH
ncbi:histone-lysine N-methyltransferase EZA1-like isoform X3 [Arachis stenosperma]|uniref:histone-lysine N-methyltransferase EZA1-like isoform X3 n=1 Tax=Arachis stenosperma TaxID=217475 RepID=UPI0025AB6A4C|nr:histone-lysine N-methyltransferase EZA1-like isoform X3 [Arachis stenosperma]